MVTAYKTAPAADPGTALWSRNLPREHGFEPLSVEGALPAELRGTLYRNGPGLFTPGAHPFEADGALTAIRLDGKAALGASRVTPSAGLSAERAAGKPLFGSPAPWLRRVANALRGTQKNTANTNVIVWQGRVLALMEAAKPTELDRDLRFVGETDLGGAVVSWFSAHPHRVASRNAYYNFGIEVGRTTRLHCYKLPDTGAARHLGAIALDGPPMLHDFIATDTHLVFFVSPVRVSVPRALLQLGGFEQMFQWRPELGTEVICVPIDRPGEPIRFRTDAYYQWHFTNAFDRGREIVVDYVRYPNFDTFHSIGAIGRGMDKPIGGGVAHRAVIDLAGRRLRSEPLLDRTCEFPTVAPGREGREHGVSFLALDDLRGIGKLAGGKLVEHVLPDGQRASEPLFVPRPGAMREDDGWVLALCHTTERAFLAVYDAARLPDGPIARAWFDHHIPITFHGTFAG